jgi:phosphoserine phosphatase RsbU/P
MPAALRLLTGRETGRCYEFRETEILIGRDKQVCQVVLGDDRAVSHQHARVYFQGDCYWLESVGKNPTFVNDQELARHEVVALADGDRIGICDWRLEFHCDLPVADEHDSDSSSIAHSVDARLDAETLGQINAAGKLRVMLRISESLGRTLDTQALLTQTIDGLLEIFPQADHALVLLADGERLVSQVDRDRRGGQRRCKYSATLVREAMATRRAILSNDLALEMPVPVSDSILSSRMRSVACVPLLSQNLEPLGVIELDAYDREASFNSDDLELLNCVARQVALSLEYSELHRRLLHQARLQQELDLARTLQHSFLPRDMPTLSGYQFWAYYKATGMVGGDYYDFVQLSDGRQVVLLGDVAGKGIPAALMMARLSAICRTALLGCGQDLCLAIAAMNREVCEFARPGGFVTLALCAIDPARHEITVASAGHPSPILRRHDGTLDEPADEAVRGFPLGLSDQAGCKAITRNVSPGECVVLFTDGIPDALDPGQKLYSTHRLRTGIAGMPTHDPAAMGEALMEDVRRHSAGQPQCDDMAMVIFGRAVA